MDSKSSIISKFGNQYWIFFLVLVLLTVFMMFCNGLSASYSGFDFFFHYRRLDVLIDALRHGSYISYIDYSNAEGYGYLVKPFYPDLILLPFAVIGLFTSTYFAYDTMIFVTTILCGVTTYHMIKVIFDSKYAAFIGAILYTFAVYRIYDIYDRSALGEVLTFPFLPLVFLGFYYVVKEDYKKWYVLAIGYTLLIYTHIIASVLMFVALLILLVINYKSLINEPKRIAYLLLAGGVTVLLTAYFTLPLLEQMNSNSFYVDSRMPGGAGQGKISFKLLLWGLVSGIAYMEDYLWAGVGIVLILIIFSRLFIKGKSSEKLKMADVGVVIGICFIISTLRFFPWGRFPFSLIYFIQFPWRLYEFSSLFFAVAGGYYLSLLFIKEKQRLVVSIILILTTMGTTYIHSEHFKELFPKKALYTDEGKLLTDPAPYNRYHTIGAEYFPAKLPSTGYLHERGEVVEFKGENTQILNMKRAYNLTSFEVNASKPDVLILPLTYYHGYIVTLNDKEIPIKESSEGFIEIEVGESGLVKAYYEVTDIQRISFYISLVGAVLMIIFIFRKKKNEKQNEIHI